MGPNFSEGARQVWLQIIARGTSQEEIRRALGLGRGLVHRYLYGDLKMSLKVSVQFEDAYGIAPRLWLAPPKRAFVPPTLVRLPDPPRKSRRAA